MVPGLPDLADGLYELPYWQLPLLVLHRPWLRPDLDRFVCQLVTHHMEEADRRILDPRESRRVASRLPPAGKPALTHLILLLRHSMRLSLQANELTNDFWSVTLPANLESASARSPELFAYIASQNRLNAPVLFSHKKIPDLLDPTIKSRKKALERHHLFPRAWLESQGIEDLKIINQLANFALLEWPENIDISDSPPTECVPQIRKRFILDEWIRMIEHHALPEKWHDMSYEIFLQERRKLMASVIRRGFETLE